MGTVKEPKITLIGCTGWDGVSTGGTTQPLKLIASQLLNMQGKMYHDVNEIDEELAVKLTRDLKKTALAGCLETIDMIFQIENIPRALTHQLVRTRVGATYHQESLRFTTREEGFDYDMGGTIKTGEQAELFCETMDDLADVYKRLIELGVSTEDARGVLPINTLTKVGVKYNFKTLVHCGHVRLCFQSQGHWNKVFSKIKQEISDKIHPVLAEFLVPICDVSGRCEYKGIFDRKCPKEARLIEQTCSGCRYYPECDGNCAAINKFHRLEG